MLAPAVALFVRWMIPESRGRVIADVDLFRYFVTTWGGVATLLCMGAP